LSSRFYPRFGLAFALVMVLAIAWLCPAPEAPAAGREEAAAQNAWPRLEKLLAEKKLSRGDPLFIRIFKDEDLLEIWMKPKGGDKFIFFKSWPICAWSGALGPKTKTGDNQAPEGFYAFGLNQLNPFSQYHLSFNLGYPNAYDRSLGYTGSHLMVHGRCVSIGCFAMTDPGIEEIYSLAQAALTTGQPFIRVHSFPFRLTDKKLKAHSQNSWLSFWLMLRPVYDHFEKHRLPPDVAMDNGRYRISGTAAR